MRKLEAGMRVVVASHNTGKVWEINQLIAPFGLDAVSAGDLGLIEPEETEPTFTGNASLKAVAAASASGLPALADDSGLEVECLGGAPGIYSARWAGPGKDFGLAMRKVGEEITARHGWSAPGPRANFISVLCLAWPEGETQVFEGKVYGHLVWPPRGGNGFGYDAMFVPDGETLTYGEMEPAQKYAGSHRTRAFAAFKAQCLDAIQPTGTVETDSVASQRSQLQRDIPALRAAAASISTKAELVAFTARLADDLTLANATADERAVAAFVMALRSRVEASTPTDEPTWRTIAKLLLDARLSGPGSK